MNRAKTTLLVLALLPWLLLALPATAKKPEAAKKTPSAPETAPPALSDAPFIPIHLDEVALTPEDEKELAETWEMARSWGVGALKDKVPEARRKMAAMGAKAVRYLIGKLGDEYSLAQEAHRTIFAEIGAPAVEALAAQLEKKDRAVRSTVILCLSGIPHRASADALAAFIEREGREEKPDDVTQFSAIMALSTLGDARAVALIRPFARAEKEIRRVRYAIVLRKFAPQEGFEPLLALLGDDFYSVRYAAQEALEAIGPAAVPGLLELLRTGEIVPANHAAMALGTIGSAEAWVPLQERLSAGDWSARGFALEALSRIDARRAERLFAKALAGETHPFVLAKLAEAKARANARPSAGE